MLFLTIRHLVDENKSQGLFAGSWRSRLHTASWGTQEDDEELAWQGPTHESSTPDDLKTNDMCMNMGGLGPILEAERKDFSPARRLGPEESMGRSPHTDSGNPSCQGLQIYLERNTGPWGCEAKLYWGRRMFCPLRLSPCFWGKRQQVCWGWGLKMKILLFTSTRRMENKSVQFSPWCNCTASHSRGRAEERRCTPGKTCCGTSGPAAEPKCGVPCSRVS